MPGPASFRRGLRRFLLLGAFGLVACLALLTQTPRGRTVVLRAVLSRVEGSVNGEVLVDRVASPGLARGFLLAGVRILADDGRSFLEADSVRATLSLPNLLRGNLIFSTAEVWGPHVRLERLPGQDRMNVSRLFGGGESGEATGPTPDSIRRPEAREGGKGSEEATGPPPPEEAAGGRGGRRIEFHQVRIHGGTLEVVTPIQGTPTPAELGSGRVGRAPSGEGYVRHRLFSGIELHLSKALIREPGEAGERFEVERLALTGAVWPEPFHIQGMKGSLHRGPGALTGSFEGLELPHSSLHGELRVDWSGDTGATVEVEAEAAPLVLQDLQFLESRLPEGVVNGPFRFTLSDGRFRLALAGTEMREGDGRIRARGTLGLSPRVSFEGLDLELEGVDVGLLDPWLGNPLPWHGAAEGRLALHGTTEDLELSGRLDLTPRDSSGVATADFRGRLRLQDGLLANPFELTLAPLEWGTLAGLFPGMTLRGPGSLRLMATGSLAGGMGIRAEATHVAAGAPPSRVMLEGMLERDSSDLHLDLTGELRPLSLTNVRRYFASLPLTGEYTGTIGMKGPLRDLAVTARLSTSGGPITLTTRLDASRPGEDYRFQVTAEDFDLSQVFPGLPRPTRIAGSVEAAGRGRSLGSLEGEGRAEFWRGTVGPLAVDTAVLSARLSGGLLHLDTLTAHTAAGRVAASGSLGVATGSPPGELEIQVESESLTPLRPFLMEEPEVVLDDLTAFEKELLAMEGVDLDTLPTAEDVAMGGRLKGSATVRGAVGSLWGEGVLTFGGLRFRSDYLGAGELAVSLSEPSGERRPLRVRLHADTVEVRGFRFAESDADLELERAGGRGRVVVSRVPGEEYSLRGTLEREGAGAGVLNVDELTLRLDSVRWNLGGPTSVRWGPEGYRVRDFRLIRPGEGGMRIHVDGFLPTSPDREGDLEVDVQRLRLDRVAQLAQMSTPLEGLLDLHGRMRGSLKDPRWEGELTAGGFRWGDFLLDGVEGSYRYADRSLFLDAWARSGGGGAVEARGTLPMDLGSEAEGSRLPENGPVDLTVRLDSFPAGTALAFLQSMEDVDGSLTGAVHLGGTPSRLEPEGEVRLSGGAASFPALGVRHRRVEALFSLSPDGTVVVDGSLRSEGPATVTGTVTLTPASDPLLDLDLDAREFLAVNRRDLQARVTGHLDVLKSYRRPRVEGSLSVEQGVLMVEEVARTAEVVDLSDPSFFDVVDTTLVTLRPIIQSSQNPFLQNLQLDVGLSMTRDSWLRGRELNVEMAGDLRVYWDRTERNLALAGELQAVRGVYTVLGRQFQVEEGTVRFQGTPGINPALDIRALNRLRTFDNERLEVIAQVGGTLLQPRVSLTSNAPFPISESDLVSYLIFGRPTYALASGQSSFARGAAGSLLGAATGAGVSLGLGMVSSELGSVFTRGIGLDYLAISQGQNAAPLGTLDLSGTVATTQVEIGQYLSQDVFAALSWRPLTGLGAATQSQFAGLRLEWRLSDRWTLEGFVEDRFARGSLFRPIDLGYRPDKVLGFFFYREWGY